MKDFLDCRQPSERLLEYRESLGLQQKDLAEQLGVSVGTLGFAERGDRAPSKALLEALFNQYGLSANWVLFGAGDPIVERPFTPFIPQQASEGAGARQNGTPSDTGPGGVGAPSGPIFLDPDFWDRQMARGPLEWVQDWAGVFCLLILFLMAPFALPILAMIYRAWWG